MRYILFLPCLMLFGSLVGGLPYAYFQLLRIVVTGFAAWFAYKEYREDNKFLVALFGITALLFNPLIPFYMSRYTWLVFDVAAGILFAGYGAWELKRNK